MKIGKTLVAGLLTSLVLLSAVPTPSSACGPFFQSAVFDFEMHPSLPLSAYAAGRLGVVRPSFARSYQVVAYRYLTGKPLAGEEQEGAMNLWRERLNDLFWSDDPTGGKPVWNRERARVVDSKVEIDSWGQTEDWTSYINYTGNSFENAAETLKGLITKYGAKSKEVVEWVEAQDRVFGKKVDGKVLMPEPLAAGAPEDLRRERDYQIAAALFYGRKFDEALAAFDKIAADKNSPHAAIAPYLAARCLVRKGTLGPKEKMKEVLKEARDRLDKIVADQSLAAYKGCSERLMSYIDLRLDPDTAFGKIAARITGGAEPGRFGQDLNDLTWIWDNQDIELENEDKKPEERSTPEWIAQHDLGDWMVKFGRASKKDLPAVIARYKQNNSLPWLICALSLAADNPTLVAEPDRTALVEAASRLQPGSPGYLSATYYMCRLLIASGHPEQARPKVTAVLASRDSLPPTSVNLYKNLELMMAKSLNDFVALIPRRMAGYDYASLLFEIPSWFFSDEKKDESAGDKEESKPPTDILVEPLTAAVLNRAVPLSLLVSIASSPALPSSMKADFVQNCFVRALILDRDAEAVKLSLELEKLIPGLKQSLTGYRAQKTAARRKFEGLLICLRNPGLRPFVTAGLLRDSKIGEMDSYRDNWWGTDEPSRGVMSSGSKDDALRVARSFLSEAQIKEAEAEKQRLFGMGPAPNYLANQILTFARTNSGDPEVPEALHLVVKSTRYGDTDDKTTGYSKACFQYLHKTFPKSDWAKKTPYYF
ncbi:MAG: hypothetical protein KC777_12530 [Cyanobacteria bacterium HKST-UBA02]|nr:hypothetical protein [Cyanobacteria bacterium HKST-UBA02]